MKIYNQDKTQILENVDMTKGRLVFDIIHHPETLGNQGKCHYNVIKEYENGGKDVECIWDEEPQEYIAEYDEDIQVFIPYTEQELQTIAFQDEMLTLKNWFDFAYAQHEQKYRRLLAMNTFCDDGSDPNNKLIALYEEAETRRKRIQELERLLGLE